MWRLLCYDPGREMKAFGGITLTEVDWVPLRGETTAVAGIAAAAYTSLFVSCQRMLVRHRRWYDGRNDGRHGR